MPTGRPEPAAQLLFTNVEADRSPTRKRGFQVWLCSPTLTPDQQRAVAKRVDDFRLPVGAAGDGKVERHAFFRLNDGELFVVARTVPLNDRDKFGRGGKFHAHAVAFDAAGWAALGDDPFAVIDGGFPFQDNPDQGTQHTGWEKGEPPPVGEWTYREPEDAAAVPPGLLADLMAHVERGFERPVVVAANPAAIRPVLRACFRAFPATVRRKLEYDTLSTGAFPPGVRYAVAGGYGVDHLRTWASRRYHLLDAEKWACSPKLDPADGPAGRLLVAPGWAALAPADRDALYNVAAALTGPTPDALPPGGLSPETAAVFDADPGARTAVTAAAGARLRADLPPLLAALPGVADAVAAGLGPSPAAALPLLARPLSRDRLADALLAALATPGTRGPAAGVIDALDGWLAAGEGDRKLDLLVRRWRGDDDDVDELAGLLDADDGEFCKGWLREWLPTTLDAAGPDGWAAKLAVDTTPGDGVVRDARLALAWAAADGADVAAGDWSRVRLLAAFHRGADAFAAALGPPPRPPAVGEWLVEAAAARLRGRFAPGWGSDRPGELLAGLFLLPDGPADEALIDAVARLRGGAARNLLHALWRFPAPPPRTGGDAEPDPPAATAALYKDLVGGKARNPAAASKAFRVHLAAADDNAYRWAGNQLLRRVYGEQVVRLAADGVFFLGLKLVWVQMDKFRDYLRVFEAVAGAAAPEVSFDPPPEPAALPAREARRFSWLLARLEDPNGTERLKV